MRKCNVIFTGTLIDTETADNILFLLDEGIMARYLYSTFRETWNLRVFENIAKGEETHRSRMQDLAESYGLEYRVLPVGELDRQEIQSLFDNLLLKGSEGIQEALVVGRLVEIPDIADIDEMMV